MYNTPKVWKKTRRASSKVIKGEKGGNPSERNRDKRLMRPTALAELWR
jgi:hypothetical protein